MLHGDLTDRILKSYYRVYNSLGYGFLEKVYENALVHELRHDGLMIYQQHPVQVFYGGTQVGDYFADLLVEGAVIIELKAAEGLRQEHVAQLTNYLKATTLQVGLLLNFGLKPEVKRVVFSKTPESAVGGLSA